MTKRTRAGGVDRWGKEHKWELPDFLDGPDTALSGVKGRYISQEDTISLWTGVMLFRLFMLISGLSGQSWTYQFQRTGGTNQYSPNDPHRDTQRPHPLPSLSPLWSVTPNNHQLVVSITQFSVLKLRQECDNSFSNERSFCTEGHWWYSAFHNDGRLFVD